MASGLPVENSTLNPPSRIDNTAFHRLYSVLCIAVTIYKLDAVEGIRKEAIIREHGGSLSAPDVRFDLSRIDRGRKGWTRYYPVAIGDGQFIVRIFLTGERVYQPQIPVLCEVVLNDPAVTCQLLPGINSIIESRRIRPHNLAIDLSSDRSA